MYWERITIDGGASEIVIERDIIKEVFRWSVRTGRRFTSGESETAKEAFKAAFMAANKQQEETTNEAIREFIMFDIFDR